VNCTAASISNRSHSLNGRRSDPSGGVELAGFGRADEELSVVKTATLDVDQLAVKARQGLAAMRYVRDFRPESDYTMTMERVEFRNILLSLDLADRPHEANCRQRMVELLDSCPNCFQRDAFPAHFTGSAFVVSADGARGLLHHHRKLDRWLQFGGHCDGEEDVLSVAQREAYEESGIDGLVVASERPFDLDIHEIPALGNEPEHLHYDVRYVLIAPWNAEIRTSAESKELRWFTAKEMKEWLLEPGLRRLIEKWRSGRLPVAEWDRK
jgi:8-oxo-dGTP pyrophosphatase MutT (NUDIX family)